MRPSPVHVVAGSFLLLVVLWNCRSSTPEAKRFTPDDVVAIRQLLQELEPDSFRIVLPEFEDERPVGSRTYGSLPLNEVRRVASLRNIDYQDNGNLQAIFQSCSGGGAGSHTESESAARGFDERLEQILAGIDESEYLLIR